MLSLFFMDIEEEGECRAVESVEETVLVLPALSPEPQCRWVGKMEPKRLQQILHVG